MNTKNLSLKQKLTLLNSNDISLEQLEELSNDKYFFVRRYVAKHKNCSLKILEKLSDDKEASVKFYLLENDNCPAHLLIKLYSEFPEKVRIHPNCPDYLKVFSK